MSGAFYLYVFMEHNFLIQRDLESVTPSPCQTIVVRSCNAWLYDFCWKGGEKYVENKAERGFTTSKAVTQ